MLNADERDDDRDELEDADLTSDEELEDDENDDEDEESEDSPGDESDDEDDNKPVTRKELRALLEANQNKRNADRRVNSKGRPGGHRDTTKSPKTEERLSAIEQSVKNTVVLEKKRTFGFENNLSPKQVDVVFRMTKRPTAKFLKEPYVKAALDAIAQQSNVRDNTPSSGGRHFKSQGGKSWDKMDADEKQANFADRRRAILASKGK